MQADKTLKAHIKGFPQPNEIFLRGKIKKGLPLQRTIYLIGVTTPQLGGPDHPDDPYAFQAREFLRERFNAKAVEFVIEHKAPGRKEFARVMVDGEDVITRLLLNGFARLEQQHGHPVPHNIKEY